MEFLQIVNVMTFFVNCKSNGYFADCGAADGIDGSNSLFFERYCNWTGLLLEANNVFHENILKIKRRKGVLNKHMLKPLQEVQCITLMVSQVGSPLIWISNRQSHGSRNPVSSVSHSMPCKQLEILKWITFHWMLKAQRYQS